MPKPRWLVACPDVFSLRHTSVQIVEFDAQGDQVLVTAHSRELLEMGWNKATGNLPAAYLTGYLAGKKAVAKGLNEAVLDIGLKVPAKGATVFAALKGMLDAGMSIPHGKDVLPSKERLAGKHIGDDVEQMIKDIKTRMEAN